jgi:hypothetical protein
MKKLFEYVKNALCTSYLFLLLAIIVVLKQLFESDSDRFIREMHEKQREEQLNTEFQRMVAEQAAIDRAIGRRVYGDGNPEHLESLNRRSRCI